MLALMSAKLPDDASEHALNISDLQLRELIDAMPHVVWIASAAHGCEFLNRRWEEFTGLPAGKQLGI
jgi:PAS domain-containing protein